jgi:hypothetical protein
MSLPNESRERSDGPKVRYAVVGAGRISQEGFMPGVQRAGNSVITTLVTGGKGAIGEFWQILLCVTIKRAFVK